MATWTVIVALMTVPALCWGEHPCSVGSDCPREMCCKGTAQTQAYCHPLKTLGQDCQMYSGLPSWGQTPWKVAECRCQDGFYCGSDNPTPPLGSRGTCRKMPGV